MLMKSADHIAYNKLQLVEDAHSSEGAASAAIEALGEVFVAHAMEGTAQLSLLHRHFGLLAGERLIRSCGPVDILVAPSFTTATTVPCAWYLKRIDDRTAEWLAYEHCLTDSCSRTLVEQSAAIVSRPLFLDHLAARLCELNVAELFSLTCAHLGTPHLDALSRDRRPLEYTDVEGRVSRIVSADLSLHEADDVGPTRWSFARSLVTTTGVVSNVSLECKNCKPPISVSLGCKNCGPVQAPAAS